MRHPIPGPDFEKSFLLVNHGRFDTLSGNTMSRGLFAILCVLYIGLAPRKADAQQKKSKASQYRDCEILCADLNLSIQRHPERLGMWLEDALVINESCAGEIVAAAIDAVGNQSELVRAILETAIHTSPRQEREIRAAVERFAIPAAKPMIEPVEEIRRAVMTSMSEKEPEFEVRRALVLDKAVPMPIEEIRRAVIVETKTTKPARRKRGKAG